MTIYEKMEKMGYYPSAKFNHCFEKFNGVNKICLIMDFNSRSVEGRVSCGELIHSDYQIDTLRNALRIMEEDLKELERCGLEVTKDLKSFLKKYYDGK